MWPNDKIKNDFAEAEQAKYFNEMNYRISEKEILYCITKLKNRKATGLDIISNKMIKYSQHAMLPGLIKLFNMILSSGKYPKRWCEGYIVPIPKGSDNSLMSNYRGLTMLNCLAKLFNAVLNERITKFLDKRNIIDEKQIGFKKRQ